MIPDGPDDAEAGEGYSLPEVVGGATGLLVGAVVAGGVVLAGVLAGLLAALAADLVERLRGELPSLL